MLPCTPLNPQHRVLLHKHNQQLSSKQPGRQLHVLDIENVMSQLEKLAPVKDIQKGYFSLWCLFSKF